MFRALIQILDQRESLSTVRTLVFCNSLASCREVENALNKQDKSNQKVQSHTVKSYLYIYMSHISDRQNVN